MMGDSKKLSTSDDEEDLEALRLAALRTIKKKNDGLNGLPQSQRSPDKLNRFNRSKGLLNKRRFFGSHHGRNCKNGQFSNRNRNPNLIAIPTTASDEEKVHEKAADENGVTINLPQHRYCGTSMKEEKKEEETSKFNRYNKSDESESESEEDEAVSEDNSPGKLHKADSLEALMQELDDEIQGKNKSKENLPVKSDKPKMKKIKKKKQTVSERMSTSDSEAKVADSTTEKLESDAKVEVINHDEVNLNSTSELNDKQSEVNLNIEHKPKLNTNYSLVRKRPRSRSPLNRRGFPNRRRPRGFKFQNPPIQNMPFVPYPPPVLTYPNPPFNPLFAPPNVAIITQPPPFFERPLSPLAINTESLTTATLAPLSPRSAAFVLENKAIIERRKRRSYSRSRSPSRSPRRSLTPRRSPRRSISPRRLSRSPRRVSRSPRRRSLSPRRRSLSPRRRNVGKSADVSPKNRAPVRERLGVKSKMEEVKEKPKETLPSPSKEEKPLDPVLEARKRKFESNEIKMKEGIIRLKPKEEKLQETQENATQKKQEIATPVLEPVSVPALTSVKSELTRASNELKKEEPDVVEELENLLKGDTLLESDAIDLYPKVDDIFSDEDSASDNEGRFKVKENVTTNAKPSVLSFTKLVNGVKREIKDEPLPDSKRRERRDRNRVDKSRVKVETDKKPSAKKPEPQQHSKPRISMKSDRHPKPMERRFDRKIEIKIKNPSKYERGNSKSKPVKATATEEQDEKKPKEEMKRKVEVENKDVMLVEEEDPEIVVENSEEEEEDDESIMCEGDLRTQLSKKRAEKLHRIPVDGVSSRLLQNALQGAVFKKTKRKSKEQDITSSDGKLPIHLRLGIANSAATDIFTETPTKPKRKSRKRKNREVLEQVYYLLLRHCYPNSQILINVRRV